LPDNLNDNRSINALANLQTLHKERQIILVSKDINMRLKARACGVEAQDYHTDQLVDDIDLLPKGYQEFEGSFWDRIDKVETIQREGVTEHILVRTEELDGQRMNDFVLGQHVFIRRMLEAYPRRLVLEDLSYETL